MAAPRPWYASAAMQQRGKIVVVKKYSNRRLYDTGESRYITLDELAQKIRRGTDVRVIDAASEEDLTQATLTQLILESGRAARLLPVQLLSQLIRMDDDELAEFFNRYMSWAMELYLQAKNGAQAIAPYNPFATLPFMATNALARFFGGNGQPPWEGPPGREQRPRGDDPSGAPSPRAPEPPRATAPTAAAPGEVPPIPAAEPPTHAPPRAELDEVAALRRELEELKDAIRTKLADR